MIQAQYKNNIADYKKLGAFHLLYARGIRTYVNTIVFGVAAIVFLVIALLTKNLAFIAGAGILFVLAAAWPFLMIAVQNGKVNKKLQTNRNYERAVQYFTFKEDGILLKICIGNQTEEHDIPYTQIPRIYERKDRFYIYIGPSQVLIVKKSDIDDSEGLVSVFRTLGKRFHEQKGLRPKSE